MEAAKGTRQHRAHKGRLREICVMSNEKLETRTLLDEIRDLDNRWLFHLGHPLLNRVAESFVKAAGIGAVQAVTREAYFTTVEGSGTDGVVDGDDRKRFSNLRGENYNKSLEAMVTSVKTTGKESFQWGLAAGVHSGLTYGLREARGSHDWKNSAVAGAITGATLALTADNASHEQVVQCAITGAAISTAANLLSGIF